ncbi:MAG: hypothetical protein FJZ61_05700 [Chlamydiae bacterium]|nr:hypothetical protein [Chlamydiota bacterium]
MFQSLTKNGVFGVVFPLIFFIGCASRTEIAGPSKEEKMCYVQTLKERILKAETAMMRLKFDKEKLNSRFGRVSKAEFVEKLTKLDAEIEELKREMLYLRSLNLDDLYDYP